MFSMSMNNSSDAMFETDHVFDNGNVVAWLLVTSESLLQVSSQSHLISYFVAHLHEALQYIGFPKEQFPTPVTVCRSFVAIICTLLMYYLLLGKRHYRRRERLAEELEVAKAQVNYLQDKLHMAKAEDLAIESTSENKKEVRIFMDGAFDMMHYGHMNAFRLGRSLGTHLIVGVNSDDSITECKGAPLMKDQERLTMVQACKFVDEVVPGCPYIMNRKYLDYVIEKYNIDYVIHGDDPCIVDGKDVYAAAKQSGKFQSIPRTEGVSTTDIVGRMLLMTKDHHYCQESFSTDSSGSIQLLGQQSKFLTTSRLLRLFSAGAKAPSKEMRVIYIDGAWDMFHCGHVAILKAAKERGDYLIVGVHGDAVVNQMRGSNLPLMNLHERVLSVLGCRYVDDVLIDAPYEITRDMVASLNIAEVVHGSSGDNVGDTHSEGNRYQYPKNASIFHVIASPSEFNLGSIVSRIQKNQETFQAKFERKMKAEKNFYNEKYHSSNAA